MTQNRMIACHKHGTRLIYGTEWPIETFVEREPSQWYGFRTRPWKVVVKLCDGVPEKTVRFKTKKDAMAYFTKYCGEE